MILLLDLRRPLLQRLRQQRNGRHKKEHPGPAAIVFGDLLRQTQRRERLAGAARHDELAAIMRGETLDGLVNRLLLMRPGRKSLAPGQIDLNLRTRERDIPVDGGLGDLRHTDAVRRNQLVRQRLFRRRRPQVGRGNDGALREMLPAVLGLEGATGGLEEGIEVSLANPRRRLEELALDRRPLAVLDASRHQVDARVGLAAVVAPILPAHDLVELALHHRIGAVEIHHQLLEGDAVLALRLILAQLIQDVFERGHDSNPARAHHGGGRGPAERGRLAPHSPTAAT